MRHTILALEGHNVPERGPVATNTLFAALSGSTPAGSSSYIYLAIDARGLVDHIGSVCIDRNRFNRTYRLTDPTLVAKMNFKIALWKTGNDTYASSLVRVEPEALSRARELTQMASCTPLRLTMMCFMPPPILVTTI